MHSKFKFKIRDYGGEEMTTRDSFFPKAVANSPSPNLYSSLGFEAWLAEGLVNTGKTCKVFSFTFPSEVLGQCGDCPAATPSPFSQDSSLRAVGPHLHGSWTFSLELLLALDLYFPSSSNP